MPGCGPVLDVELVLFLFYPLLVLLAFTAVAITGGFIVRALSRG